MKDQTKSAIKLLEALTERAKELTCLYAIEELLKKPDTDLDHVCRGIIEALPPGWQYPEISLARIVLEDHEYKSPEFKESPWMQSADVVVQEEVIGRIQVYYTRQMPTADDGPFLKEEQKLIETIADRLGHFVVYLRMQTVFKDSKETHNGRSGDWEAVLDLLRQTDNALFLRIANKMLNHLCWSGIEMAEELKRSRVNPARVEGEEHSLRILDFSTEFTERIFRIAAEHLSGEEILSRIHAWIHEDKLGALVQTVHGHLPLSEVADALRRYHYSAPEEVDPQNPLLRGLKVSLIRRILSDRLEYINLLKKHVSLEDLYDLLQKVILSNESRGRLGGKSAGLFLASQALAAERNASDMLAGVKVPKTWYIASDMMLQFMHYNNIDEIIEHKYKEVDRARIEYPHVVQTITSSVFPPEMVKGMSMALDDLEDTPLIVRCSSLLEDRLGAAFCGRYKSLLVSNQGTKQERLAELQRAVAEVYASIFDPDVLEYRSDMGLLDFAEEMAVMIQEVVGRRVGPYFLPAFSGVALSRNEFRWSPKIRSEDGVIRLIPGLGSQVANGNGDAHPVWIAPGRPETRLEMSPEELIRSAPRRIEVIHLEKRCVETIETASLLEGTFPCSDQIFTDKVATFEGLIKQSPFILLVRTLLKTLEDGMGMPVEIEFAHDGERFYLLQCRRQTSGKDHKPAPIPKDIPSKRVVFSARRLVSNGRLDNLTHVVSLNPDRVRSPGDEKQIEDLIGQLNRLLPKRQFVFMLPCGWCGGGLTHAHIRNAGMIIEVMQKGAELSLGTRLLQTLVESNIRYLPVFPEDEEVVFNRRLLNGMPNLLSDLLPEYAFLDEIVRIIDIPRSTGGMVLQVRMNADLDEALGFLAEPRPVAEPTEDGLLSVADHAESYWRWRMGMAEQIAAELDAPRFGVAGFYVFGSTKNGTAGPGSDIDILVHFQGDEKQREALMLWLEGWSLCLDQMNYLRTGYRSRGLLDVHLVTDEDIANKSSYAVKIGAVTDAARPLKMSEATTINVPQ